MKRPFIPAARGPWLATAAIVAALFASSCGNGGGANDTGGDPAQDANDVPEPPVDPCEDSAPCDRQTVGDAQVATGGTATGYRTVIAGPGGAAEIVWIVSGGRTTFRYRPVGGVLGPEVTIDGTPAGPAGPSRAAAFLYGHALAAAAAGGAQAGAVSRALFTGSNGVDNTAGCDQTHLYDCTTKGECCDVHDDCINQNCSGQGDCGNVWGALQAGYTSRPCDPACLQCHGAVVRCFLDDSAPGESDCCREGDCGKAQQCMIDGVVITDPCVCKASGLPTPAACQTDCVASGQAWVTSPSECCQVGLTAGEACRIRSICCSDPAGPCTGDGDCCGFADYVFNGAGPLPSCGLAEGNCLLHTSTSRCVGGQCTGFVACNYLCADGPGTCPAPP